MCVLMKRMAISKMLEGKVLGSLCSLCIAILVATMHISSCKAVAGNSKYLSNDIKFLRELQLINDPNEIGTKNELYSPYGIDILMALIELGADDGSKELLNKLYFKHSDFWKTNRVTWKYEVTPVKVYDSVKSMSSVVIRKEFLESGRDGVQELASNNSPNGVDTNLNPSISSSLRGNQTNTGVSRYLEALRSKDCVVEIVASKNLKSRVNDFNNVFKNITNGAVQNAMDMMDDNVLISITSNFYYKAKLPGSSKIARYDFISTADNDGLIPVDYIEFIEIVTDQVQIRSSPEYCYEAITVFFKDQRLKIKLNIYFPKPNVDAYECFESMEKRGLSFNKLLEKDELCKTGRCQYNIRIPKFTASVSEAFRKLSLDQVLAKIGSSSLSNVFNDMLKIKDSEVSISQTGFIDIDVSSTDDATVDKTNLDDNANETYVRHVNSTFRYEIRNIGSKFSPSEETVIFKGTFSRAGPES